jgi:hypothetical protein
MPRRAGRLATLQEQVRSIEALVKDSMVSKAVSKVCQVTTFAVGHAVLKDLADLFPAAALPAGSVFGVPAVSQEIRDLMLVQATKHLKRYPARAAPGPNGSRFEHWAGGSCPCGGYVCAS